MENNKKKTRIRRKNNGIRKLLFFLILLILTIFVFIKVIVPGTTSFARYVYTVVRSFYLNSKEFYFNSDKLSTTTATFESSNWSGSGEYEVPITMNSKKNMSEHSNTDIIYTITYEYEVCKANGEHYAQDSVEFYLKDSNKQLIDLNNVPVERTIFTSSGYTDLFFFSVKQTGTVVLKSRDYILVTIKAKSTRPYESELTGKFKIIIGNQEVTFKIEDQEYSPYAEVIVTNEFNYYISDTNINDRLSIDEYLALDETQRNNYHSKKITLTFDPREVVLDTTSGVYLDVLKNGDSSDLEYETITRITYDDDNNEIASNVQYVKKIKFYIEAEESKVIRFYKVDASQNYTYDSDDDYLAVSVEAV